MMKRPSDMWSNMAAWPAVTPGWYCGMQMTPVPNVIYRVWGMRLERNWSGEVICSTADV